MVKNVIYLEDNRKYTIQEKDGAFLHSIDDINGETFAFNLNGFNFDVREKRTKKKYGNLCFNCNDNVVGHSTSWYCKECKFCKQSLDKRTLVFLIKNGVVNAFSKSETKEKIKRTMINKYGSEHYNKSDEYSKRSSKIQEKIRQTNMLKYGVDNYTLTDSFKEDKIKKMLKNKGFEEGSTLSDAKALFSNEVEKVGFEAACLNRKMDHSTAYKFFLDDSLKNKGKSKSERDIYLKLKDKNWFPNLEANVKSIVPSNNKLEIDILDRLSKTSIEYSGFYWHQIYQDRSHIDLSKAESMRSIGYTHYMVNEVDSQNMNKIINSLNPNKTKVYAKQCVIQTVPKEKSRLFLDEYHFQGHCNAKCTYGLYYENQLVQLMSFSKSRFSKDIGYEMIRLCTSNEFKIVGGSQKLFKHFVKEVCPTSIVSFSDNKFFSGEIYKLLGFEFVENTQPNYVWYKNGVQLKRYQTMKHKLETLLGEGFDVSLSETENMERNGWIKVKDLGNKKWIWYK